jgi:hypothetical protein
MKNEDSILRRCTPYSTYFNIKSALEILKNACITIGTYSNTRDIIENYFTSFFTLLEFFTNETDYIYDLENINKIMKHIMMLENLNIAYINFDPKDSVELSREGYIWTVDGYIIKNKYDIYSFYGIQPGNDIPIRFDEYKEILNKMYMRLVPLIELSSIITIDFINAKIFISKGDGIVDEYNLIIKIKTPFTCKSCKFFNLTYSTETYQNICSMCYAIN